MTLWKKTLSTVLAVCALSTACIAGAAETVEPMATANSGAGIQPMADYVQVDTAITASGTSWSQPRGYSSYRVWVENTTKQAMKVTITYSGNKTHVFSVPAGKSDTYVVNDAPYGTHKISFDTVNHVVSGTVRVRVANVTLA